MSDFAPRPAATAAAQWGLCQCDVQADAACQRHLVGIGLASPRPGAHPGANSTVASITTTAAG